MLLECAEPKFIIINLTEIDHENDDDLIYFLEKYDCAVILPESERRDKLKKQYSSLQFYLINFTYQLNPTKLFKRILSENKYEPYQTVYITGSHRDLFFAQNICLSTILITTTVPERRMMPDLMFVSLKETFNYLERKDEIYGYYGENVAIKAQGRGILNRYELEHFFYPGIKIPLFVTGRYFSKADPRSAIHPLTQRILKLKQESKNEVENQAHFLSGIIQRMVEICNEHFGPINLITPIPSKPDETINHMAAIIDHLRGLGHIEIDNQLLYFNKKIPSQKEMGNHTNRFLNVKGAISAKNTVQGHIVLVDDIVTSGATLLEAAKTLYEAGADRVTAIVIGSSQTTVDREKKYHYSCPSSECEGTFKLRFNSQNNDVFFGCSEFPRCRQSGNYEPIRRILVRQNILSKEDIFDESDYEF